MFLIRQPIRIEGPAYLPPGATTQEMLVALMGKKPLREKAAYPPFAEQQRLRIQIEQTGRTLEQAFAQDEERRKKETEHKMESSSDWFENIAIVANGRISNLFWG
jgi:hypothetical protein